MSRKNKRLAPELVAAIVAAAVASQHRPEDAGDRLSVWQLRGRASERWSARPRSWAERGLRDQLTER